ncbi:mechanosensitive ion channel family protein [Halorarius halobius]|uniref:mechanosensitive ion channel family protein n=1 Tax=Halorarius halobius TaxID=2962671 RepID=UPI0020CE75D1|nr:mechanosensitive ion channel family protein [Halorarius halobius]
MNPQQAGTTTPTPGTPTPTPLPPSDGFLGPLVSSRAEQFVATALILGAVVAVSLVAYRLGPTLDERLSDDGVEAVQAMLVTTTGIVAGVALVAVWRLTGEVDEALQVIDPSAQGSVKVLITLLAFGLAYTATRITKRFVRFGEGRDAITNHQREILHHITQIVVFLPALLFAVALWEVPAQDLLLSASVLGVVLGLAARQTLGAVLAGFVLLFSRPFEVGDWVEIDENEGVVTDISIVNTQLQTFDDEMVMLPNDQITNEAVVNKSRNNRLRVQVDVGVDYETDVAHAMETAASAMEGHSELMDAPEPDVVVDSFGDSAVVLNLRFWIANPTIQKKWAAQNAVMGAVKEAFEAEDIAIPFPQRVLAGREQADGLRITGEPVETGDREETGDGDRERPSPEPPDGADDDGQVEQAVEPAFESDQDVTPSGGAQPDPATNGDDEDGDG